MLEQCLEGTKQGQLVVDQAFSSYCRHRLYPTHTSSHRSNGRNLEKAQLSCSRHMGATTQLYRKGRIKRNHTYVLAILLAKKCCSTHGFGG